MIIRGFIDESYSGNQKSGLFTLTCVFVRQSTLVWFEWGWQKVIDKANAKLREQGRPAIKRFHATELNGGTGEFEGWTQEERIELAKSLIQVIRYHISSHMALTMDLTDLQAVWPDHGDDPISLAFNVMMKLFMLEIGEILETEGMNEKIDFVIERGPGSEPMLSAFDQLMTEEQFKYRERFESVREGSWESDVLLQVADLFSYEAYKDAQRREQHKEKPRKSMQALLELDSVGIRTRQLPREAIAEVKRLHDERPSEKSNPKQQVAKPETPK
jgi:hypothetical protein